MKTEPSPSSRPRRLRLVVFAAVVLGLFVASFFVPARQWLGAFRDWVAEQGAWGAAVYGLAYVVCTVLFVPGLLLTIGAGALYGPVWGTMLVSIAATAGASAAFLIARYVARDQVRAWLAGNPKFAAVDAAVARRGAWIVFLLRLSPLFPFNLLNYALGLTGVSFPAYVLASWVGMLPGGLAYVLVGYAGRQALAGEQQVAYWVVVAVVTLAVTFVLTRVATRVIREATEDPGKEEGLPPETPLN
jgi:uncharacterized membrane protein YdjX (TVP38/TMEM64 family)